MPKDFAFLEWDQLKERLLPYLKTEKARENLKTLQPFFSLEKALVLRDKTFFIWQELEKGRKIELPNLPSLEELFQKSSKRGFFLPKEVSQLALWIETALHLANFLENSPFSELISYLPDLELLYQRLKEIFELERGELHDRASYQLYLIRKKRRELEEELIFRIERLKEFYWEKGYLNEDLYLQKEGRYVLPAKPEFKNKIRGVIRGFSQSGATVFIEPLSIIELTNELEEVIWQEEKEVLRILKEISQEIFLLERAFRRIEEIIADFDLALAKALLGRIYRGVFPEIVKNGTLILEEAFHPLLFFRALERKMPYPVKNNYYLERALLITGPNLGGKTVTLKTIGISVLMALNGFLIPAKKAIVPFFSKILVDLGDEQDLWEGESSFSSHLKNLKRILEEADPETLILLDEPGRGTNPEEGAALIWAIIERLLDKGAKIVLTTHSHLLKSLSSQRKEFQFAKVDFDRKNYAPTYKLDYGYLGDSHAFDMAKKIGIEEEILERAKEFLQNKDFFALEERYLKEIEALENLKKTFEERLKDLEREKANLEKTKEALKKRMEEEIKALESKWQEEFLKFLNSLPKEISRKKALEKFQEFLEKSIPSPFEETFKEGDKVYVEPFKCEGIIQKLGEKKAEILSGNIKLEVPLRALKKTNKTSLPFNIQKNKIFLKEEVFNSKETINLIGEDVETALTLLEKKINECFMRKKGVLLVIHGHGTGKLRLALRKYLTEHPLVESIEEAPPNEGGGGATRVYLAKKE
ncbi:MAG: endonuclease MutS2 [Caldimicrobium sp.]